MKNSASVVSLTLLILFTVSLIGGCASPSRPIKALVPYSEEPVKSETDILLNSGLTRGQTGYVLLDPSNRRTLVQLNAEKPFLPASTLKIVTAACALKVLGHDHRFKTRLTTLGKSPHNGVLTGDIYLVGGGDPLLSLSDLMGMAQSLKKMGIKKITGRFFYDSSSFPEQKRIDASRDSLAPYNPGISALSSEFNRVSLRWKPAPGSETDVQAFSIPPVEDLNFKLLDQESSTQLGSAAGAGWADWVTENNNERLTWLLPSHAAHEGTQNIPISNPAYQTARVFRYLAKMEGLELQSPLEKANPAGAHTLITHESETLLKLSEKILEYSNNLMAELLLVATARRLDQGDWLEKGPLLTSAAKVVSHWLKKQLPTVNWQGFELQNGSGLGGENRITATQLAAVLEWADTLDLKGRGFTSLLPISGWKGFLSKRLNNPNTALQIWAKTGTLNFSHSLAGALYARSGKKLYFVILNADSKQRAEVEVFDSLLPNTLKKKANTFIQMTDDFQENLLTRWIMDY